MSEAPSPEVLTRNKSRGRRAKPQDGFSPLRKFLDGFSRFKEESSFIRHYLWQYRRWVGIGLLALIVVDLLEILPPILLKEAVDVAVEQKPREYLMWFAAAYFSTHLIQGVCRYGWRMFLVRTGMYSGRDLRGKYANHLFGLSASFYDRRKVGDLMSLATNDVEAVRMAIGAGVITLADALFYFLTVPIAMFFLSPQLTLLAFLPLPLVPWFVMRREKAIQERFNSVQEQFGKLSALAQENLNGIRVVKAYAREDAQIRLFREAGEEYIRRSMSLARVQSSFGPMLDFFMSLGLVLLLFLGGRAVITDAVTLGTFVAFQRYIQKMIWPMTAVGLAITFYQRAVASSARLKDVLQVQTDVPEAAGTGSPTARRPRSRAEGRIEFRNLHFSFPGSQREALKGIDLTVEPGERIALVGGIGSGKSALLSLIPRMYPVASGMLFLDGVDVNHWSVEELRRQIGYVSQEVFLFSDSVLENVALGINEWDRSEKQFSGVERAVRMASVHDEIAGLQQSWQTRLGERGVNLSGGQKQRLTIARALAREPSILVLDDALSSVDVRTEEKILQSLRSRPGRNTELIAAHRISTVRHADRVVVMHEGKLVQQGTHVELMQERSGIYCRFYEQQRLKEDLEQYVKKLDSGAAEEVRS